MLVLVAVMLLLGVYPFGMVAADWWCNPGPGPKMGKRGETRGCAVRCKPAPACQARDARKRGDAL